MLQKGRVTHKGEDEKKSRARWGVWGKAEFGLGPDYKWPYGIRGVLHPARRNGEAALPSS